MGVAEDHAAATEDVVRKGMTFANRHRRELDAAGHVADRVDVRHRTAAVFVDDDGAFCVELDACGFEPEARTVRQPAQCAQHRFGFEHAAVVERCCKRGVTAIDARQGCTGVELNALRFELDLQVLAHLFVETTQHARAAQHHTDLGAQATQQASKLERDITGALHHDSPGQRGPMEELVRARGQFAAGDLGRHVRRGAGGDQHLLGMQALAARQQVHRVRIFQHRALGMQRHPGALQRRGVSGLEARDLGMHALHQHAPVETRRLNGPAEAGGVVEALRKTRRHHHQLLRHAAANHASAADAMLFSQRDAGAVLGGDARSAHAARTSADDEQIYFTHRSTSSLEQGRSVARASETVQRADIPVRSPPSAPR